MKKYEVKITFSDGTTTSQGNFPGVHEATEFIDYVVENDCDDKTINQARIQEQ